MFLFLILVKAVNSKIKTEILDSKCKIWCQIRFLYLCVLMAENTEGKDQLLFSFYKDANFSIKAPSP